MTVNGSQKLHYVFVYGTLKTRQVRECNWPVRPQTITLAWTLGRLYDTGPYPALLPGNDAVAGQVWGIQEVDMPLTLQVLDEIEGTNQPGMRNDYDREKITVHLQDGGCLEAERYVFARRELVRNFTYLEPELEFAGRQLSIWPKGSAWVV